MTKLLIVDDEPLVQIGIKSMLTRSNSDIDICGTASNGRQALSIIESKHPEIILTDIKMPIMSGLELLKICRERYDTIPVFIFLTSYDDFALIQEAMRYQALDYLIKLDITPEILAESIQKALLNIDKYRKHTQELPTTNSHFFYEKFMVRLLNNLFKDNNQFRLQAGELKLEFNAAHYVTASCTITDFDNKALSQEQLLNLYFSAVQMVSSLITKYMSCYVATLEPKRFCIIFFLEHSDDALQKEALRTALNNSFEMVYNYFNISIFAGVGRSCCEPLLVSDSFQDARQVQSLCTSINPIIFFSDYEESTSTLSHHTFNLGIFKNNIRLAFESYDANSLEHTLNTLIDLFNCHPRMYLQAIDAACNILYLTLSMLPDSKEALDLIFTDDSDGYHSIYKQTQIEDVIHWMETFRDGICKLIKSHHKTYKNYMIKGIQDYIDQHITDKLSLNDVASLFSISPNYLSILFKKTTAVGFNEYITTKKIALAKAKILEGNMKIYEIATELGFESAFYFSKVFKKVEGCSPRAFLQKNDGN